MPFQADHANRDSQVRIAMCVIKIPMQGMKSADSDGSAPMGRRDGPDARCNEAEAAGTTSHHTLKRIAESKAHPEVQQL